MKSKSIGLVFIALTVMIIFSTLFFKKMDSGTLIISLKDPPSGWGPAEVVYISFSDILIHRSGDGKESEQLTSPSLMMMSGWFNTGVHAVNKSLASIVEVSEIVGMVESPNGVYNVIRLNIEQAIVTVDGKNYTCIVEGTKLNIPVTGGGISIQSGQTSQLEIDVNPIITGKPDNFKLTPAIRATPITS